MRTEWDSELNEGEEGSVIAAYNIAEEEIDMTVTLAYEYFGHIDDPDQTLYFYLAEEDEEIGSTEDMAEVEWYQYTTRAGNSWSRCIIYETDGSEQGYTLGLCDENGVVVGKMKINFESENRTDESIMDTWFYLDEETGDIKFRVDEYPDEITTQNVCVAVAYDENGEEVDRIFLPQQPDPVNFNCAGTFDALAPGKYTIDVLGYSTSAGDYLSYNWNEEWEQTEEVPVEVFWGYEEQYVQAAE
jgi:hypothetical protein